MLRSIYDSILRAFKPNRRRKAPRRAPSRRLTLESLESRKLMTVTLLTTGSISDANFAAPTLTPQAFQVAPSSSPWVFTGDGGVASNNSAFTHGDPNAPSGTQVAFLKDNATMSQTVELDAGVYNLSVLAVQRVQYQTQSQAIKVTIDGTQVGVINPVNPVVVNDYTTTTAYASYETSNFTVTAGVHTVEFTGLSPQTAESTAFLSEAAITPAVDGIVDGGFELPAQPQNGFVTDPSGSAWQFSGTAGIAKNGSPFLTDWTTAQNAPAGTQVGYLQENGSMIQTDYLDAGTYQLTFLAAQRAYYQASYQQVEILVDNTPYGIVNPVNTLYGSYQSSAFTVSTGIHTIEFLGLNPKGGDNTVFIDQVALSDNALLNGSFETPTLAQGTYKFAPAGAIWQFQGTAGVAHNGSSLTSGNSNAPDGLQVAVIQGGGSMTQSVNLLAGSYEITFQAAQGGTSQSQEIQVLLDPGQADAQIVGLITPTGASYYHPYATVNFAVAAGVHTIEFLGLNPQGGNNRAEIDEVSLVPTQDEILDGNFATPVLASNSYQVAPVDTPWQFSGTAGISTNGSSIASGNPAGPTGPQIAYISNAGSISYTAYLDANTYSLSFDAAQRANNQAATAAQSQVIEVLIDPGQTDQQVVGLITPSVTTANSLTTNTTHAYTLYRTSNFTVTAGVHTIEFLGRNTPSSGQSTALLDAVSLVAAQNQFIDGGFEAPVLAAESYATAPAGSAWQFTGTAGVTNNQSGFTYIPSNLNHNGYTYNSLNAPQGTQVAFVKDGGSVSQTIDVVAGTSVNNSYSVWFLASQRVVSQTQNQQIEVLVDNVPEGTFTPATLPEIFGSTVTYDYTPYQTMNFTLAPGPHTIAFVGLAPSTADSTAFIDSVTLVTGGSLSDGSFEEPALATDTYQIAPAGSGWQFAGVAGITSNYSGFTQNNPNAPDGVQAAFLKNTGSISQSVDLAAGFYNISFMAAQRDTWQSSYESIEILVDGVQVGSATPAAPPVGSTKTTYGLYETTNFTVTAGVHTIEFLGVNPTGGDNTAFIDDVVLNT